jgi:hypothetical protein
MTGSEEHQKSWKALGIRTDIPHPARVYDYMLGGKDNISQVVSVPPTAIEQCLYRHVTALIRKLRCPLSRDCLVSV